MNYKQLFLAILIVSCNSSKDETITPKKKKLTVSVYASVILKPDNFYNLYAENSGTIQNILISENDFVKAGQTIAILQDNLSSYDVDIAKINQDLAKKNAFENSEKLISYKTNIDVLKNNSQQDSINYERQKRLWSQKIGAAIDFENAQNKYSNSKKQLIAAKKNYLQLQKELLSTYKTSNEQYLKAKKAQNNNSIKTLSSGKVYSIQKKIGERILPQESFCSIGNPSNFIIEMQIDEVDITKIKLQQKAIVTLEAFPNQTFTAFIHKIYPSKNNRTQTFLVEAIFNNPPKQLYAGLAGEANIIIAQKKQILTIPLSYLSAKKTVINENDEEIKVKLGLQNLEEVQIISGINQYTKLKKPM